MLILGLNAFSHDASAAFVKDGKLLFHAEEERFDRIKHSSRFPVGAIAAGLRQNRFKLQDIDAIAFFRTPLESKKNDFKAKNLHPWLSEFFGDEYPAIHFIPHHECHAASAFHLSTFSKSSIIAWDGRGESTSAFFGQGQSTQIQQLGKFELPLSLGTIYTAATLFCGFKQTEEWKLMGLAALGQARFQSLFEGLVIRNGHLKYELTKEVVRRGQLVQPILDFLVGKFGQKPSFELRRDIAASVQAWLEILGVQIANELQALTGDANLCTAGGVSLNIGLNQALRQKSRFQHFFWMPVAHDAGSAIGAALTLAARNGDLPKTKKPLATISWGTEYSPSELKKALVENKLSWEKPRNLPKKIALAIFSGQILGLFQGPMESGPRALGQRSILADPRDPKMKKRLNERTKKRESFRPFACSILAAEAHKHFMVDKNFESPFMMERVHLRDAAAKKFPAISHQDMTTRVQTLKAKNNSFLFDILQEWKCLTGDGILLNTSFNLQEPIVESPQQAIDCFLRTDLDVLVMGPYWVTKPKIA